MSNKISTFLFCERTSFIKECLPIQYELVQLLKCALLLPNIDMSQKFVTFQGLRLQVTWNGRQKHFFVIIKIM
jgi:hypothetical protein